MRKIIEFLFCLSDSLRVLVLLFCDNYSVKQETTAQPSYIPSKFPNHRIKIMFVLSFRSTNTEKNVLRWKAWCCITAEWWLTSALYEAETTDGSLPQDNVFKDIYAILETIVRKSWPQFVGISRNHHSELAEEFSDSVCTGYKQHYPATPLNAESL